MKTFFFLPLLFCSVVPVFSQCLDDQKALLLGLRSTVIFDLSYSTKLVHWNQTADCCSWNGVECDVSGHIISLQLDQELISGGIEDSRYLFNFSYLEKLNLAHNMFYFMQIPKGLSNLANLTHLNLSRCELRGQNLSEVLRLKKLVSLDLSENNMLENPDLKTFAQSLTKLKEVYLDDVDISPHGNDWFKVLSSSLPDLRILSLRNCNLSGPIGSSLLGLRYLSVLQLDHNHLASTVPDFFANFSRLTSLSLSKCSLFGSFPQKIFEIPSLQNLDFSYNLELNGTFPNFSKDGSLRTITLSSTNFSGPLPDSISNLTMLSKLELNNCSLLGPIPQALGNLTELTFLDISGNSFIGSLSSTIFERLSNLEYIDLGENLLSGNIPSSLFSLPSLQALYLGDNEFQGPIQELSNMSFSLLKLSLYNNHLEGPIPTFFFELDQLVYLDLSSNKFNGTVQLEMFKSTSLSVLALSYNDLFIQPTLTSNDSNLPIFPNITWLDLVSCKLQMFPNLHRQSRLYWMDLSSNNLKGEIPNWIWEIGNGSLGELNLSYNQLDGFQKPYKFASILFNLDLSFNQLKGELPILPRRSQDVDFSYNHFTNSIPNDIGASLSVANFLSISNNHLTGEIPPSICDAGFIFILDLSGNSLTGNVPPCLPKMGLSVLRLGRNNLSGRIPDTFPIDCTNLKTLDLNTNVFEGKIPRSLANCTYLGALNVGNNRLQDTFPCMLMKANLSLLVLRSNKFYGNLRCPGTFQEWSNLQIIDISSNEFSGGISFLPFSKWRGMVSTKDNKLPGHEQYLCFPYFVGSTCNNQNPVNITIKGMQMELKKILTIFTLIDFSNNKFHGEIPYSIGVMKSLYGLNLSYNKFTGSIPESIGNMTQLGSLDLSMNELTGKIPVELANLTFMSVLDLSHNKLSGKIPSGHQIQTFPATSFEGNVGLCGFPTKVSCDKEEGGVSPPGFQDGETSSLKKKIDWDYIFPALGFAMGLGGTMWLLLHCKRLKETYFGKVDQILLKLFPRM